MLKKPGLSKIESIRAHSAHIWDLTWSPTSDILASCGGDWTVRCWDYSSKQNTYTLKAHSSPVTSLSWSSNGQDLASASRDGLIVIASAATSSILVQSDAFQKKGLHSVSLVSWSPNSELIAFSQQGSPEIFLLDSRTLKTVMLITLETGRVRCLAWSPDSTCLAVGAGDHSIYIWDIALKQTRAILKGHYGAVLGLSWSNSNGLLASASSDETVRIWDPVETRPIAILEGHTNAVFAIQFSPSGNLLVSRSHDNTYRLWRAKRWDVLSTINESTYLPLGGIAFHPNKPLLALKGISDNELGIWSVDELELFKANALNDSVRYVNARVVLTGDTGVGKSALSLVLTGKQFIPTDSTHSRKVWTLDSSQLALPEGVTETREMLLWDLAGQPGYRLIHQLYLTEVAVAIVVFDSRSETDPFSGVRHWERALRHAQGISNISFPMKKILVAARCDRGALPVSRMRVESLVAEMNYVSFIETSAKEGIGITSLLDAIKKSIDWEQLPKVSSNELFQSIKQFLFYEKQLGRVIASVDDLLSGYLRSDYVTDSNQNLVEQFETCIGLVESRGLIQRLSFGRLVLLQPELLDAYASSIIEAAKQEPDGLGSIKEINAREGRFFVPSEIRLKDNEQEKLLCIATVENLIRHELAIRQDSNSGTFLVFPSQFTRNWEEAPNPSGEAIKYLFEGPVYNIYARLAVRLSHSGVFTRKDMWRNACSFTPTTGKGICGVHLNATDEGKAELTIFYGADVSTEIKSQFDEFVSAHLNRHALRETIEKQLIIECDSCEERLPPKAVHIRLQKGLEWITCPTCDNKVQLAHAANEWKKWQTAVVNKMERAADKKREYAAAISVVQGKQRTKDYDVFISYHSKHKYQVLEIANQLKDRAILPWLDMWELRPGIPWQKSIAEVISNINSAAVMIGQHKLTPQQKEELQYMRDTKVPQKMIAESRKQMEEKNHQLGLWQDLETEALIREFVKRGCPVIPVILPGVTGIPKLPGFLESMTFVDFRKTDPEPLQMLLWGITGKKGLEQPL